MFVTFQNGCHIDMEIGNNYLTTVSFDRTVHKSKQRFDGCFSVGAPQLWNSLPFSIRTATSVCGFPWQLKTYLFDLAYPKPP